MCLAVPGRVLEVAGDRALVDFQGNRASVCCVMTPDVKPTEWVLVHAGFAITTLDEATARRTWSYLDNDREAMDAFGANEVERD